ncbi:MULTISPECIES: UbiH/UbiF/VisC/COQ6 family ubiquinone biosynthesis hydroxylase [unclassified Inquilinus]|uniref:UbiH/UbiF/VisC/COQ6 family ubiquinone biosynthesis hydroxylase n=1 Tax=unclassified Inquilinus TaxID=2645927 RepID=UPI003F92C432
MNDSTSLRTQVVVVGGGLAGATMAAAIGQAGIDTVILDQEPAATRTLPEFDGRTTALSFGSRKIVAGAGLWDAVARQAEPILDIRIADGRAPVFLHFDHQEMAAESDGAPFGHIVENRLLRLAQFERLESLPTVRHIAPAKVVAVETGTGHAAVTLADGRVVRADLMIGADGRASFTRQALGIPARSHAYRQKAVVCVMAHAEPHDGIAVEHFLPAGPFAVLPMTDDAVGTHRSSIVWTEEPDTADDLVHRPIAAFDAALQAKVGDWLGPVRTLGKRFAYPLGVVHARHYSTRRAALIGEAAHGIHPIAGQGLNLGLRDIAVLAELLVERSRLGLDLGDPTLLRRYEQRRRPDNVAMILATDGLNRLFSTDLAPVQLARDIGLAAVGRLPPVKRFFMRQAMGLGIRPR